MKVLFVGNVLDVVFMDNSRVTITGATDELYNKLLQLHDNEEKAKELMVPYFQKEVEQYESAINFEKKATQYPELKRYGDVYIFHKISDVSVPKSVIDAFIDAKEAKDEDRVESILNFWTMACTVADSRVRNNIFWYCEKYGIKLSKYGQLKLYRNVVIKEQGSVTKAKPVVSEAVKTAITEVVKSVEDSKEENTDLTAFISQEFIRVRTKAKKNPANFTVIENETGLLVSANEKVVAAATRVLGNLKELYNKLSEDVPVKAEPTEVKETTEISPEPQPEEEELRPTIYTDAYTRSMHIQIGKMVMMDRNKCDSRQEETCSSGLHCASKQWLESQGKGYFGSGKSSLLVLVNPTDIVAIPPVDGYGKLRTCAYLPVKALTWEGSRIVDDTYDDVLEGEFFENVVVGNVTMADSDSERYTFNIPENPEISSTKMQKNLADLKDLITKKKSLK